jgi:membrane protease YdiL (CAAX protease family)
VATIVTAGMFGAMHSGVPGAMGWIRVLSATFLGIACGQGRQATGSVVTPIALHVIYNLLAVGNSRRWFVVEGWLKFRGVPWPVIFVAMACLFGFVSMVVIGRLRRLRKTTRESTAPAPVELP